MLEIHGSAYKHGVAKADIRQRSSMQYGSSIKMMDRFFILERLLMGSCWRL
jgi:hypothetical protein